MSLSIDIRKIAILIGVAVVIIALAAFAVSKIKVGNTSPVSSHTVSQESVAPPLASQTLNKDFQFPVNDANGNEITNITYTIQSAELRDQIIIDGQKATAIAGRQFLVLNLKLVNPSPKDIQINTRNYVRLTVNNTSDLLAPDIHNDPVDVQPTSTKYTRIGFPINTTDKNLKLQVGEISGPKTTIPLKL